MRKWILNKGFRVFCFKKSWRVAYSHRSFSTEPGWQENFWINWFFDFQPSVRSSHRRPFFIFGNSFNVWDRFIYLWSILVRTQALLSAVVPLLFFTWCLRRDYHWKSREAPGYEKAIHVNSEMLDVKLLYNGHLGDRRKVAIVKMWPFVKRF